MEDGSCIDVSTQDFKSLRYTDRTRLLVDVQQGAGYSGYHGGEFVNVDGDHEHAARMALQGDLCMSDGEVKSSGSGDKRPLNKAADDAPEPEAKRQHVMASSPERYKSLSVFCAVCSSACLLHKGITVCCKFVKV